jgi:Holliday junction resolvase-like predicted endonuclease
MTRTTRGVKPAEAAINHDKQYELRGVAREYLRHLRVAPTWRFDVVSVYCDQPSGKADMELFKNAFPVS